MRTKKGYGQGDEKGYGQGDLCGAGREARRRLSCSRHAVVLRHLFCMQRHPTQYHQQRRLLGVLTGAAWEADHTAAAAEAVLAVPTTLVPCMAA